MTEATPLTLYSYWRSSASYRVRMALNLKGLDYRTACVHLVRDGGQQHAPDYVRLNPQSLLPTLRHGETVLTQSPAILEYLEERFPEPALLPSDPAARARVRAICSAIGCEIHPLNNLRVLKYLTGPLGLDETKKLGWYRHWVTLGFDAIETMLGEDAGTGTFCHGETPTLADCYLLPQVYNACRFECDTRHWPTITAICERLAEIPAVAAAAPENQPDAE